MVGFCKYFKSPHLRQLLLFKVFNIDIERNSFVNKILSKSEQWKKCHTRMKDVEGDVQEERS